MADDAKTYTAAEVDALVKDSLAKAKAEGDTAFQNLWTEAKAAKEKLRAFDGVDPEEAKTLKQRYAELEQQKKAEKAGITSAQLDKMRSEIAADYESKYAPIKSTAEKLAQENRSLKLDTKIKDFMGKNGVRAERIDALFRLTSSDYDLTEDGVPMVKSKMGTPVEKYIAEDLSKLYPEFFVGTGSSGGGASKSTGGAGGVKTVQQGDQAAFMANLKGIADGTVKVQP